MANRHISRSIVLQTLFELDFRVLLSDEKLAEESVLRIAEEFSPGMGDDVFMKNLVLHILQKRSELDLIIEKAAPDWPIGKISIVDRNILRLGLYELLFSDRSEVPAKVAINEAIELAKTFGGETSSRFVNGVLGAVYKEIGEPGKDETSKKEKRDMTPDHKAPIERLGGAVVYTRRSDDIYLAFVHDIFGHWTLSKGKIGETPETAGESVEDGTKRGLKDEIGLDVELRGKIGENSYITFNKEKKKIRKSVTYFLAESPDVPVALEKKGGLDNARWVKIDEIETLNFYDDLLPIITKGVKMIIEKMSPKAA